MRRFCPTAEPLVTARLEGYRVGFALYDRASGAGGCTLEPEPGHQVLGLLYELTPEEFDRLDRLSGVDRGYYQRIDVEVETEASQRLPAITYLIPRPEGPLRPAASYTRPILAGARALGLPAGYLRELETRIESGG
jgi:gamma-glutamylcyclotransferase (GGCT)/AIG2-like uncharacterized protein YtfP